MLGYRVNELRKSTIDDIVDEIIGRVSYDAWKVYVDAMNHRRFLHGLSLLFDKHGNVDDAFDFSIKENNVKDLDNQEIIDEMHKHFPTSIK